MAALLTINGLSVEAAPGATLFDCAERLGIRVPTSCHKQGKCRECMVEVTEGLEHLSPPTDRGAPPQRRVPPLLPHQHRRRRPGPLPHHAARPHAHRDARLAGTSRCDRRASFRRPGYGLAMDLGTTTIVLRLLDLETGELVADASFENPAALRRVGRHVAHPL